MLTGANLNDIYVNGWYCWESAANQPWDWGYMLVISTDNFMGSRTQIAWSQIHTRMCRRTLLDGVWTPWADVAMAEPLTWYDLPLVETFGPDAEYAPPQYAKTQFGAVIISGGPIKPAANDYSINGYPIVARLPEGYRPLKHVRSAAVLTDLKNDNTRKSVAADVVVDSNGYMQMHADNAVYGNIFVMPTIVFPVAD